jgi:sugar phosphate isomerase/epimerase
VTARSRRRATGARVPGGSLPGQRLGLLSSALPGWEPETICRAAARAGLQGLEWATGVAQSLGPDDPPARGEQISKISSDHGLAVCGLSAQDEGVLSGSLDRFERLVELAVATQASQLRVFAPSYAGGVVSDELDRLSDLLAERVSLATGSGVVLLVEMAPATLVPGPEFLVQVARRLPSEAFGAVYDPGSMMVEGHLSPTFAVAVLGRYLHHVHVKDVVPRRVDGTWKWVHVPPGTGLVPWPAVLGALADGGYGGWLVLDHLSGRPGPARLRADIRALRALLDPLQTSEVHES